jgi:hypothetical protein
VSTGADVRRDRTPLPQLRGAGSRAAITVFAIRDGRDASGGLIVIGPR